LTSNQSLSTRRFFDRQAAAWPSQYRDGGSMSDRVARFLGAARQLANEPGEALDLGCGSGEIAAAFAEAGWRVTGCDPSPAMIVTARANWPGRPVDWVTLTQGRPLPLPNARFDLVVVSSVLEYVDDLPTMLAEIARVLRPGGFLLATVPDMDHPARRAEEGKRRIALNPLLLALARFTPWRSSYEYLSLSINRLPLGDWAALLRAAGLAPSLPESGQHPLALITAERHGVGA
jgi:ubiquinone/menaquinone biosynthesis C-methylase UbiE